jgi:hypothetical protein
MNKEYEKLLIEKEAYQKKEKEAYQKTLVEIAVLCRQCKTTMVKTKIGASYSKIILGLIILLVGLPFLFSILFLIGIPLIIVGIVIMGSSRSVMKCPNCGYFFERAI